jgi:hypothetical protein
MVPMGFRTELLATSNQPFNQLADNEDRIQPTGSDLLPQHFGSGIDSPTGTPTPIK